MKITLPLFFCALALASHIALAVTVTMRAPSLEAAAGGAVEVPLELAGASGIGALQFELIYDPAVIQPDTVTRGALAGGNALIDFNPNNAGRLIIGVATLDEIKGDGPIATARFKVVGQAGQSSTLAIKSGEAWEGASHQAVLVKTEDGTLTVVGSAAPAWLKWLLIALGALALLFILFVLIRRKRQSTPAQAPTVATTPAHALPAQAAPTGGSFCSYCGNPNVADAKFCSKCGKPLAKLAT